jgi:hypothetical protein
VCDYASYSFYQWMWTKPNITFYVIFTWHNGTCWNWTSVGIGWCAGRKATLVYRRQHEVVHSEAHCTYSEVEDLMKGLISLIYLCFNLRYSSEECAVWVINTFSYAVQMHMGIYGSGVSDTQPGKTIHFKIGDLISRIMSVEDLKALWLLLGTPSAGYLRVLMPLQE